MSAPLIDPIALALSPQGVALRQAACAPRAPVRLGLLVNARARQLTNTKQRAALLGVLPEPGAAVETPDLASVRRALALLLCVRGTNVLAIAGGDGTLHHAINALMALTAEAFALTGVEPAMPRLLILNGGTLNIVGRTVAIHGPPQRTLQKFLNHFSGAPLSRVPARRLTLLAVRCNEGPARFGFVFGSEVAYHALELYGRFGAGYGGLTRFLFEFARGAFFGSALWRQEGWKMGPYASPLEIDGEKFDRYTGVCASTVDLTLAIAAVRTIRRPLLQPGFAVRLVQAVEAQQIVRLIPALMSEHGGFGVRDFAEAHHLTLCGPYTLDGECFHEPALNSTQLSLDVSLSAQRLYAVPGDSTAQDPA